MRWTEEMDDVMREVVPGHHQHEAIALFEERTGIRLTIDQFANRRYKLGLHAGVRKSQPRTFWTPEREAYFREIVPGHHEGEISRLFCERFGVALTESQIGNAKCRFGVKSGTDGGQFRRGQAPANKGRPQAEWMSPEMIERTKATRFKKGEVRDRPDGWVKPVGYERISKDGYVEVKVHDGLQEKANVNYRPKHHVIWEQLHGAIPPHTNIVFADGDKRNFDPENLVAVSRSDWATIKKKGLSFSDAEQLETHRNIIRLSRAIREAEGRTT